MTHRRRNLCAALLGATLWLSSAPLRLDAAPAPAAWTTGLDPGRCVISHPCDTAYPYPRYRWGAPPAPAPLNVTRVRLERGNVTVEAMPSLGGIVTVSRRGASPFWSTRALVPRSVGSPRGVWAPLGGVELCFPLSNHGSLTLTPWQATVRNGHLALETEDRRSGVHGRLRIDITPEGRVRATVSLFNPNPYPVPVQAWLNFMFPRVASAAVSLPASRARVHFSRLALGPAGGPTQRGQREQRDIGWPDGGGLRLDRPGTWPGELGLFPLADRRTGVATMRVTVGDARFTRQFPVDAAPGLKLWSSGDASSGTGEELPYFEVWGGTTRTFEAYRTLGPRQTLAWTETWTVTGAAPTRADVPLRPSTFDRGMRPWEQPPPPPLETDADQGAHALSIGNWTAAEAMLGRAARRASADRTLQRMWREARLRLSGAPPTDGPTRLLHAENAVKRDPGDATAWATLAALRPRDAEARAAWRQLQALPPERQTPCGYDALVVLGLAERRFGRTPALALYEGMAVAPRDAARAAACWEEATADSGAVGRFARHLLDTRPY